MGNDLRAVLGIGLLAAILNGGQAQAASLTRTSSFTYDSASGLLNKEIIEPTSSNLCLVTTYAYDAYGNKTGSTTRNCNGTSGEAAAPTGGPVITARSSTVTYDARGQFPISSANALSQSDIKVFNAREGNLIGQTGPNGLTTTWQYDTFGRKTLETRADGTKTEWEYLFCAGYNGGTTSCPASATYYATYLVQATPLASDGVTPNGPWAKTYYDALNRVIRTETLGFDGVTVIRQDTQYDSLGRVSKTSRPYYSTGTAIWTTFSYDALRRVTTESRPDSSGQAVTEYGYNGLITTVTNPLDQVDTRTINSQGQLVSAKDNANKTITYLYDPFGNLVRTTDPLGNVTSFTYDLRGRKTQMVDRDMGSWSYIYNPLGELIKQTDAEAQLTILEYDVLGRMTRRREPDLTSNWYYDKYADGAACPKGIGKLCEAKSDNGYTRKNSYDTLGRPSGTITTIDTAYSTSVTYDAEGRVATQTYPTGFAVKYLYTSLGFLRQVRDNSSNALYWRLDSVDAEGHILRQTYGNNVITRQVFEANTGRMEQILGGTGNAVQNLSYVYDNLGKVQSRSDVNQSLTETFLYDNLNRLTSATVNSSAAGIVTTTYGYNAIGNITSRTGVGIYTYNASGATSVLPHAVSEVNYTAGGKRQYTYDANGNLVQEVARNSSNQIVAAAGRTTTYTSYNKASAITTPANSSSFQYGPEHQRIRQITASTTTIYLNPDNVGGLSYEKDIKAGGVLEHRHFITGGGSVMVVVKQISSPASTTTLYFHRDHLGSVTALTDDAGQLIEQLAYDSFGKRRQPAGQADPGNVLTSANTERGYTNHEQLDEFDLINMNGRIYDPTIGRFMSADPFVQDPGGLQSYNRYSYGGNSPLVYTDPSGYFLGLGRLKREAKRWEQDFRHEIRRPNSLLGPILRVGGAAGSTLCGPFAPACAAGSEALIGRAQGVTGSDLLRSAAISAASTYAFNQAGSISSPTLMVAAYGTVGGLSGVASSGDWNDFGSGFLSAAISAVVPRSGNDYADVAISAIVGGTSSELTGGKFANGASTAAFLATTVAAADYYRSKVGYDADILPGTEYSADAEGNCCRYEAGPGVRPPGPEYDVSGLNRDLEGPWFHPRNTFKQGGIVGRFVNYVLPFGKATSHLHDTWLNVNPSLSNAGTMLPAYAISAAAVPGAAFRGWESNPMVWRAIAQPYRRRDDEN